ncbi:hypothetical protein B0H67DRAFT_161947 [Lasiosphaeris hirsuta]|uniref:Uncharacterized protein n=1 Tax=Lasiosphaeris hirsuta TaxID=260670 RepID=A0AA40APP3_9PEZI|nr:hypothetical protein B0H67DRAFT_161947 [Lasiosphaeris hirsuta]
MCAWLRWCGWRPFGCHYLWLWLVAGGWLILGGGFSLLGKQTWTALEADLFGISWVSGSWDRVSGSNAAAAQANKSSNSPPNLLVKGK